MDADYLMSLRRFAAVSVAFMLVLALGVRGATGHESHDDHDHDHHDHGEEEQRHHDTHVHGHGTMSLAADGNMLRVELKAPAHDFLGFEHVPETEEQRTAVASMDARLNSPGELFAFLGDARCSLQGVEISGTGLGPQGGTQIDVEAGYDFTCGDISALSGLDMRLFDLYPAFEEIEVIYLLDDRQSAETLTPANNRLTLD